MDRSSTELLGFVATFYLIVGIIILAMLVFMVWLYWRIFDKAGYNGALALLNLIPAGHLICLIILAFGRWPAQDRLAPPAAPSAPGSSVMPTI